MADEEKQEMVEHKVVVDRFLEVTIKFPLRMDAIEFGAVCEKAKSIMRLSAVEVPVKRRCEVNEENIRKNGLNLNETSNLLSDYVKLGTEETAKKYGLTAKKLWGRVFYLRNKVRGSQKSKVEGDLKWTDELVKKLEEIYKKGGKTVKEMAVDFNKSNGTNFSERAVSNKVYHVIRRR